ncbi:NADH-quinone oxidoreductase subunit J [soil metagenome]
MITFAVLAVVMVVGALGVVLLRQPVHAALSLVGTLLTLAVVFVTLQAHFLAAIQVIVYGGAIMVLFLFVIMLLNLQEEATKTRAAYRWVAYGVGVIAAAAIAVGALLDPRQAPDALAVSEALRGGSPELIAEVLFGEFMLAFQLVGVLLLTGMVGAVALVQRHNEPPRPGTPLADASRRDARGTR